MGTLPKLLTDLLRRALRPGRAPSALPTGSASAARLRRGRAGGGAPVGSAPTAALRPGSTRKPRPTTRAVDKGVRIAYSPNLDGDPDPGEVVWAWVPYEDDPTLGKDRPVVIIGRHGTHLSGVALTSQRNDREPQVDVGAGAWDQQGRTSYAKVDRLLDLDPDDVRREGAVLDRRRFDRVVDAVGERHDISR